MRQKINICHVRGLICLSNIRIWLGQLPCSEGLPKPKTPLAAPERLLCLATARSPQHSVSRHPAKLWSIAWQSRSQSAARPIVADTIVVPSRDIASTSTPPLHVDIYFTERPVGCYPEPADANASACQEILRTRQYGPIGNQGCLRPNPGNGGQTPDSAPSHSVLEWLRMAQRELILIGLGRPA
ncbi:uncharacterized protein CANTADRAFT_135789 [Suhomyces tanzawaensis NRRL Y-17324]|uniref:Uncharacterized protein n=1 Tax=Suhomyces tanzawaensis NRRL Y-17324 TaxID=984487 RepID=A0A1E4SRN8_9ASCO|nr:uncharacterized protein CANTADRAFT_135789 [Suhomyces tanzawaensis NRRL Y-17324]ODV82164.1 hypothetical protein CANTADRAFT_135789 [Suhomyces tanzawaensis NRRL Y-17324]